MIVMGIDIGITGAKVIAFSGDGKILAKRYREYSLIAPEPGWQELDPHKLLECVEDCVRQVNSVTSGAARAFAVSCQGETGVALDAGGKPLYNATVCFDARTHDLGPFWKERISAGKIFSITGMPFSTYFSASKIVWFKQNMPEIFNAMHKFLCVEDYLLHHWGIEPHISYPLAGRTMMFDVNKECWSEEILEIVGIGPDQLARPARSGQAVGTLPRKTAERLGFKHEVTAVTGGHDQPIGAFGAGVVDENSAVYGTGTTECVTTVLSENFDENIMLDNNICRYHHVVAGKMVSLLYSFTGGNILKWYRDNLGQGEVEKAGAEKKDPYEIIMSELPEGPTRLITIPHFTMTGTPYLRNDLAGAIIGLRLDTGKKEIVKSLIEGLCMEMKLNTDILSESGSEINEYIATGGSARSRTWLQIKADVLGKKIVKIKNEEAACFGAAYLAGMGQGQYHDYSHIRDMIEVDQEFYPDDKKHAVYQARMEEFKKYYELRIQQ